MNSERSKTSASHRFRLNLTDKRNLKDPKKNMPLTNLSIYCTWKNRKSEYNNNLKLLLQLGMTLLIHLMVLILLQPFKISLHLSSRNAKL